MPRRSWFAGGGAWRGACAAIALAGCMTLYADRARGEDRPLSAVRIPTGRFLVAGAMIAPVDGSPYAFASGHATTVFGVAPALARDLAWKADAPAHALATLTALGPRKDRRQELSDVLDGATFGILGRLPGRVSVDRDGIGLTLDF